MAQVELGVGLFPIESPQRMVALARLAEELGYSHLWFGDSQLIWREVYVNLGAAAVSTRRAVLGTGVTNPLTRDLTVTASALATLYELTEGRVALGIGMGDSSVATLSKRPATLARLEEAIGVIRGLLLGETVPHDGGQAHLTFARGLRVPVFIGASGPRILRLSGKVADGVIMLVGIDPAFIRAARAEVEKGAAEAGRDLAKEGFKVVCWAPCSMGEDGRAARDFVKAHVARVLKRPLPFALDEEDKRVQEEIYRQYDYYEHMAVGTHHGALVPDRLVDKFAIAGTPEECREQVRELLKTGIDQIAIIPHTPDPQDRAWVIRTFAEEVVAKV